MEIPPSIDVAFVFQPRIHLVILARMQAILPTGETAREISKCAPSVKNSTVQRSGTWEERTAMFVAMRRIARWENAIVTQESASASLHKHKDITKARSAILVFILLTSVLDLASASLDRIILVEICGARVLITVCGNRPRQLRTIFAAPTTASTPTSSTRAPSAKLAVVTSVKIPARFDLNRWRMDLTTPSISPTSILASLASTALLASRALVVRTPRSAAAGASSPSPAPTTSHFALLLPASRRSSSANAPDSGQENSAKSAPARMVVPAKSTRENVFVQVLGLDQIAERVVLLAPSMDRALPFGSHTTTIRNRATPSSAHSTSCSPIPTEVARPVATSTALPLSTRMSARARANSTESTARDATRRRSSASRTEASSAATATRTLLFFAPPPSTFAVPAVILGQSRKELIFGSVKKNDPRNQRNSQTSSCTSDFIILSATPISTPSSTTPPRFLPLMVELQSTMLVSNSTLLINNTQCKFCVIDFKITKPEILFGVISMFVPIERFFGGLQLLAELF